MPTSQEEHGPPLSVERSKTEAGKYHACAKEGSGNDAVGVWTEGIQWYTHVPATCTCNFLAAGDHKRTEVQSTLG